MVSILQVARDFETDGVPSSGKHKIRKADLREWGAVLEASATASTAGAVAFASKAVMDANLAYATNTIAWVVSDTIAANNGIYQKVGGTGSGFWQRLADLPYGFIYGANSGDGTASAIVATTALPIPTTDGGALISLPIAVENDGSPVTVSFNGAAALTIKTASGNDVAVGGLKAGMIVLGFKQGANFRLLSDQSSAAIQAAAEAALDDLLAHFLGAYADDTAATAAAGGSPVTGQLYWNTTTPELRVYDGGWVSATQAAATITSGSATGDGVETDFALPADAEATNTHIYVDGRRISSGYTLVAGALSFSEAIGDGVQIDWDVFEIMPLGATTASLVAVSGGLTLQQKLDAIDDQLETSGQFVTPEQYNATGDGTTDDTTALQAMFDGAAAGSVIYLGGKTFKYTTLTIDKSFTIWNGHLASDKADSGVQITVGKAARVTWIKVELSGGGVKTTAVAGHKIIAQEGTSRTDRAVGMAFYRCHVHGSGLYGLYTKWADDVVLEDCHFENIAHTAVGGLSSKRFRARGGFVDMLGAVGSGGNAYGILQSHDSTGYSSDPNAGTPLANNHFPIDIVIDGVTVYGPEIWEAMDVHGGYQCSFVDNHIYAAKHGIMAGNSSGDAAAFAGYQNIISRNVIDVRLADGSASGVTPGYGITVQGGGSATTGNSWQLEVTDNILRGFGDATPGTNSAPILLNTYVDRANISGNVIDEWTGYGIYVGLGSATLSINSNTFSRMSAASGGDSACIYFTNDYAGKAVAVGNVLDPGGNQPVYGLRAAGTSQSISYASDFRSAGTEYSDASANGRSAWA